MRLTTILVFTLLIQLGLLGRALAIVPCCPENLAEHHDHHSHDDCGSEEHEDSGKPQHDGEHDHHHAACVHNLVIPMTGDARHGLDAPREESLAHPRQNQRPPDEPFLALDKPPLI